MTDCKDKVKAKAQANLPDGISNNPELIAAWQRECLGKTIEQLSDPQLEAVFKRLADN